DLDLAVGVELDAVHVAVAARDRLAQARQPPKRRVAVDGGPTRGLAQSLDGVQRRPDLGVAAAEVDDVAAGRGDAAEERGEVLLRQPLEPVRALTHRADRTRRRAVDSGRDAR